MVRHRRRHLVTGSHHCDWNFSEAKVSSLYALQYFYRIEPYTVAWSLGMALRSAIIINVLAW